MLRVVAKNSIFLTTSQIFARLLGFLYLIFLARVLGVRVFGVYTFSIAFIYNFIPVADFGIERLVMRDIAREKDKADYYLPRLIPLRILLAVFAYLLAIALGLILGQETRQVVYFATFGLALVPYSLTFLFSSFLNAREKMGYMAFANIALIVLTILFGVGFVFLKLGLFFVLLAYPLANLSLFLIFFLKRKKWGLLSGFKPDFSFWKYILKESWVFAALTIVAVVYLRLSLVMVGLMKGAEAAGFYGSVYKFVEAGILIPQAIALAMFPLSSRLILKDKDELLKIYFKGFFVLLLLSIPVFLSLFFFSEKIILFTYGQEYLPASSVMKILGTALILFFVNALPANIILNSDIIYKYLLFSLLNLGFLFVLCLSLIPSRSIAGASIAVLLAEAIGFIINNALVFSVLKRSRSG